MLPDRARWVGNIRIFAHSSVSTNGERHKWGISHLVFGYSLGAVMSYMLFFFHYLGNDVTFMLVVFNFLFVSMIFPLDGPLATKVLMLSLGNMIGLFWNYLFYLFIHTFTNYLGKLFSFSCLLLSPFANSLWIVTFYSLSLTFLANFKTAQVEVEI